MRRPLRQMTQRLALQIDEGALPRWVHHLQHERAAIFCFQPEIIVVFARQRPRRYFKPVKFARHSNGFFFGSGMGYAFLKQHAPNLIRKRQSASIPEG
jgi:hypothetical protein